MKRFTASVVMVLIFSGSLYGQSSAIPAHPRELRFDSLEFDPPVADDHRYTLDSGDLAFVVEDHSLPLVNVSVFVRTGSYLDPVGQRGLASLMGGQMRAGGTLDLSAADFDEEVAFLAAQINSSIGRTSGQASVNCLTKDLDVALSLFFDMLGRPRFEESRLDLAKSQMIQSMERRNDSTRSIEGREWNRLMRGSEHFSTLPSTRESIESIARDDLVRFHQRYFYPGNFVFAIAGDVDTDNVVEILNEELSEWRTSESSVADVPKPSSEIRRGLFGVDKSEVNQGRVSIGHLGTTRDNPDRYPLIIMNDILGGGGFSSRLMTRIRSDEGLAYSVGSRYGMGTYYDGIFRVAFQSRSETVIRAASIVLEEIEKIRSELVSEEELSNSVASFVETFTRNFSSAASTANLFATDAYTGRDPEYLMNYRARISAVTPEEVLRVAKRYLRPEDLSILIVGDLDTITEGDPDYPEYSLDAIAGTPLTRIPLPDPFTMIYPE